jgi:hypothetical protein
MPQSEGEDHVAQVSINLLLAMTPPNTMDGSPSEGCFTPSSETRAIGIYVKDIAPCCFCFDNFDLQSLITPLVESLRPKFQQLLVTRLEKVLCPLKDDDSTMTLTLACSTNHSAGLNGSLIQIFFDFGHCLNFNPQSARKLELSKNELTQAN